MNTVNYTHEVYQPLSRTKAATHYYVAQSRHVYTLDHKLCNDDWVPDGKFWDIRPIDFSLENE